MVRVRLPFAACRYEVRFQTSRAGSAEALLEQNELKYSISTSDMSPNLLISMDHPLADKFGYPWVHHVAHRLGITLLAPTRHRLFHGFNHFLIHVDPSCAREYPGDLGFARPIDRVPSGCSLVTTRLGLRCTTLGTPPLLSPGGPQSPPTGNPSLHSSASRRVSKLRPHSNEGGHPSQNIAQEVHRRLADSLGPQIQESVGDLVVDLSVGEGKYMSRFWQLSDFPELHECTIQIAEEDIDSKVELFVRFPRRQSNYITYKLAEFAVVKMEHFPAGF